MSSGGIASTSNTGGFFIIAATALCCYEHLLTFSAELRYVWGRRLSGGSLLFALNRYAILAVSLASIIQVLPWRPGAGMGIAPLDASYPMACQVSVRLSDVCVMLVYTSYTVFASLRMYALYGMNKTIGVLVFLVGILAPCAQILLLFVEESVAQVGIVTPSTLQWGANNCHHERRTAGSLQGWVHSDWIQWVLVALRAHAIVYEGILLGLTWKKTFTQKDLRVATIRTPFTTVLLKDGIVYFMAIAIANTMNLGAILSPANLSFSGDYIFGLQLISPVVDAITSICMSRFLLNLLAAAEGGCDSEFRSSRWNTVLRFAQAETLGGSLCDTADHGYDDEDTSSASRSGDEGFDVMEHECPC